jgi:hypothetical protein
MAECRCNYRAVVKIVVKRKCDGCTTGENGHAPRQQISNSTNKQSLLRLSVKVSLEVAVYDR